MSNWINGNLIGSLSVGQGERGKSIEYMWRGTELGIRQEGETEYQFVDLASGGASTNGREVELQVGSGYIQWRYKGEEEWKNLIAIADLKGEKGDKGDKGADGSDGENGKSLEFEWRGTELGIKREDSEEFQYTNLKGEKGEKGDTGERGKDGIVGKDGKSLEFNWDDTSLGIRVQGDSDYKYVNLKGQQGNKGDKGETGEKGQKGDKGDQGIQGEKGQDGRDGITPNIKIGNVVSVESSEPPSITIRGDKENPILDFNIPKGIQGIQGANGQDGTNGENGKSLEYNWNGTQLGVKREDEGSYNYVDLKGRDGQKGEKGDKGDKGDQGIQGEKGQDGRDGITPNIKIGEVITVEPNEKAEVTRKGTNKDPIFDFKIPRGRDGVSKLTRVSIEGSTLNLTTDKWQKVDMQNNTTINLPQVNDFTEIHLFFRANESLILKLPSVVWKNEPNIEAKKVYEFVFTYIDEWIAGVIVYNE